MDFRARYRRECLLSNTAPLHVIESSLGESSLKFNFFRIPPPEWGPLLTSLESDSSLKRIAITIDYNEYTVNNPTHQLKLKHLPGLIASLSYHISNNGNLLDLCLNGIPVSDKTVDSLVQALLLSKSLQHLSLSSSKLSNEQTLKILSVAEKKPKLVWLELCSCGLTSRCKQELFNLIHNQSVSRENAAWKASLRQESASLELMGGLRRLSLSDNDLGDAIDQLALAVSQDNCLKALDLQFCQLENNHLNMLIEASTKNPALIFIDIANNNGLDTALVKELQSILKSKAENDSDCPFAALALPKQPGITRSFQEKRTPTPNPVKKPTTAPVCRKTPLQPSKRPVLTKSASSPVKPKSPIREDRAKSRGKQNSEDADDNLKNVREELRRERELRLDAERQVIKMYAEMESAWIKITKLEKEMKKLKKQNATLMSGNYAFPAPYNHPPSLLVDQPTLKDFHLCLGQLRTILQRLSWDPMASQNANPPVNAKTNGIEAILKNLHIAVNDLAMSVNIPEREKEPQQPSSCSRPSYELPHYAQNNYQDLRTPPVVQHSKHEPYYPRVQTSYDQHLPSTQLPGQGVQENHSTAIAPALYKEKSSFHGKNLDVKITKPAAGQRNYTSTPLSGSSAPMRKPHVSPSVLFTAAKKPSPAESPGPKASFEASRSNSLSSLSAKDKNSNTIPSSNGSHVRQQNNGSNQHKAEVVVDQGIPNERINSLKSLQNNLEGLLEQFQAREAEPFEMSKYANSLLPANDGVSVSEGENARNERSDYTMDFDSTTTSIRTITNELKKLSRNATPSFSNIRAGEKPLSDSRKVKDKPSTSRSSSTLNLSSIVDLLGDFSVGDIGSSTLTPP